MKNRTIVIVGGALAGPTAAARAREIDEHARIVLIERNRRVSYAQCGLAYHLSGEVGSLDDLDQERAEFFNSVYGVEVWTEAEAVALDPALHEASVRRAGQVERVGYDSLIVALGAASLIPDKLDVHAENMVCFRTLEDMEAIKRTLSSGERRIAVIGGGPMGIEAADGLIRAGAEVTLIEREPRLLSGFGPRVADRALRALRRRARVVTAATINSIEPSGGRINALILSNRKRIETDLVIAAIGLEPRTGLLRAAGAALADDGTAEIDERAATSLPDVYACGVCVSAPQAVTGRRVWSPQGAIADKTAQVAGANAAGGSASLAPFLGSMLVRAAQTTLGRTGLSQAAAAAHFGREAIAVTTVHAPARERYVSPAPLMLLQLIWRRSDGRVLGIEAAGEAGVDKRIDAASGFIASGVTIEQLAAADFGYEPPYNAARDPLNVAATVGAFERAGLGRSIEPEDLAKLLASVQVIDVSAAKAGAVIAGAAAIPLEELRARLDGLDRSRPVVTVSETGRRGWLAARILSQNGFSDVANLSGGLLAWPPTD